MRKLSDSIMYKRGLAGEQILDEFVRTRGKFIPYMPVFDGGHPFDRILASIDKRQLQVLEIKTVKARNAAPEYRITGYPDTGISIAHYTDYLHIQNTYALNVYIAFVDAVLGKIYGNILDELAKETIVTHRGKRIEYPLIQSNFSAIGGKIIYFPLINMTDIATLTPEQCAEIEQYSNYGYSKDVSHKKGYADWKKTK
jgi:hypothetical protein